MSRRTNSSKGMTESAGKSAEARKQQASGQGGLPGLLDAPESRARFGTKEDALDHFEKANPNYLAHARVVAESIAVSGDGTCTVDDVRRVLPPPAPIDGRVMGSLLRAPDWEPVGYEKSARKACHKRPICRFRFVGERSPLQGDLL